MGEVLTTHWGTCIARQITNCKGHQKFTPETTEFPLLKKQTKLPIELWTLKQEMETVDNHATMRKSFPWSGTYFSLATLTYFLLISRKMWSKSCGKVCNLVWIFESVLRSDLLVSFGVWQISSKVSLLKGHILTSISWNHFHFIWISFLFKR